MKKVCCMPWLQLCLGFNFNIHERSLLDPIDQVLCSEDKQLRSFPVGIYKGEATMSGDIGGK